MMNAVPAVLIVFLTALAFIGASVRAYEFRPQTMCTYQLAELDRAAADVIFIGASRVGQGIDPRLVETTLEESGFADLRAERLGLNLPNAAQYYPPLKRYLANRGAPRIVYLQLVYNFKPERQETWDLPQNPPRNQAFASFSEMIDVQWRAPLNDTGALASRRLHRDYQSLPAAFLVKLELSIYSALRYVPKRLRHPTPPCEGEFLMRNGTFIYRYGDIDDTAGFAPPQQEELATWLDEAEGFLSPAPAAPWRAFETHAMTLLIEAAQAAGSEVVLFAMPSVGERQIDDAARREIAQAFPGIAFVFPPDGFDGPLAEQLAVSFTDTHHADAFGAFHYSRFFADDIAQRLTQ